MQRQREKFSKKLLKNWYCNKDIGKIKEKYYSWLQKRYGFDEWHVSPINYRPYAIEIVNYLNKQIKKNVVEIGCGLGEIIGNVYDCNRSGYDIDSNVICAARKVYHNTEFRVGTFENVAKQDIDYLVTVNFIHGISPAELREQYTRICRHNRVAHIILDIIVGRKGINIIMI